MSDLSPASREDAAASTGRGSDWPWLLAILLLALVLRIPGLDWSLWFDEVDTLVNYVRLPVSELVFTYPSLNNHMFFSLQAAVTTGLFGESAWALRLPALIFGLLSIWAVWLLGREVLGRWQGLCAALLLAVSYHHVWFSQNARGYTGLLFWGLIATWAMLRGAREDRLSWWLLYGACFAAAMYTHLSAAFLFLAHAIVYFGLLGARRMSGRPALPLVNPLIGAGAGIAVTVLLYLPIMGQLLATFTEVATEVQPEAYAESIEHFENPLWAVIEGFTTLVGDAGPLLLVAPVVLLVLAVATLDLMRRNLLFALLFPVHIAVTLVLLKTAGMRVWPRYFLIDIGMIALLLVHGAAVAGAIFAKLSGVTAARAGLVVALLGIAASLVFLPRNYSAPKQDFAGAAAWVEAERAPDAPVVALGLSQYPFRQYYAPDWQGAERLEEFERIVGGDGEAWVVYTFPGIIERRHGDIFSAMDGTFEKARYFPATLSGGGIVVFRRGGE